MQIHERVAEMVNIFTKLREANLGILEFDEVSAFRKVCNDFIKDGRPVKGKIPIPGVKRILCYDLNTRTVDCVLKYDANILKKI